MSRARTLSLLGNENAISVDSSTLDVGVGKTDPSSDFVVGTGITMDGTAGVITATSFIGDGTGLTGISASGIGTPVSDDTSSSLNKVYYTNQILTIPASVSVDVPSSAHVAYIQAAEVAVDSGADLTIADGDDFLTDALGIGSTGTAAALSGGGGRVRADNYTDHDAAGAPTFTNGLRITGVTTSSGGFSGDLTGNVTGSATGLTGTPGIVVQDVQVGGAVTITGNLTVDGTQTIINTETLDVNDKTVGIGSTTTASNSTANGAGIEIYASSASLSNNKTFTWGSTGTKWTLGGGGLDITVGGAKVTGVVTATSFAGDGSALTGIEAGISTEVVSTTVANGNTLATIDLTKDDHKITVQGITTISAQGAGTEGGSHTIRITNSGIATVGFNTYFLWPGGSAPVLPTADGAISLISATAQRVGVAGTQLLSGASLNYS